MRFVIQILGLVFSLISSFLGLMYWLNGDLIISGLVASLLTVFQYFIVEVMRKRKLEITKKRFSALSVFLWFMYLLLAVPLSIFLVHSLNVELNSKHIIQQMGNKKISDLTEQKVVYLRAKGNYTNDLGINLRYKMVEALDTTNSAGKSARKYLLDTIGISSQMLQSLTPANISQNVTSFIDAKDALLKRASDSVETSIKNFTTQYGSVFDNWSRLQLNLAFIQLDTLLKRHDKELKQSFEKYAKPTSQTYAYDWNRELPLLNDPLALWRKNRPLLLLLTVLLFHFLALAPYLMEKKPGTYGNEDKKNPPKGGRTLVIN
jgi:hypothetical protein